MRKRDYAIDADRISLFFSQTLNILLLDSEMMNSTIEIIKNGHVSPIQRRSINLQQESKNSNAKQSAVNVELETTAHPIPIKGSFLETQQPVETTPKPKRRTRRPTKPNEPAKILTNPNIPPETTTIIQRRSIPTEKRDKSIPLSDKNSTQTKQIKLPSYAGAGPKTSNTSSSPTLNTNSITNGSSITVEPSESKSTLFERDWLQFLQEALIFSSAGLGMLVGYAPFSWVLRKYGSRTTIATALSFSAFFLVVQVKLIGFGAIYVVILRFMHGLTCAALFTFIGTNAAQWATLKEQLIYLTVSFLAILCAPAFSWYLVYKVIDAQDLHQLQILHYALAAFTFLLSVFWIFFYRDTPQQNKWVNGIELNRIVTGKAQNNRAMEQNVLPLLLKSVSTWSILIAAFSYFAAFAMMANFLPIYLVTVLKVNLCTMTSLTFIFVIICHILCIAFEKFLCGCSSVLKIRIFNTVGFLLSALLFLLLAALPPNESFVERSRLILLFLLLPLGFTTLGFIYSSVIYGRFFTQHIMSSLQIPFSAAMFFAPLFVVFITVDNESRYWRFAFLIIGTALLLSSVIFALLISGQPASWAEHSWDPTRTYKMKNIEYISRGEECGLLELRRLDVGPETD